jgi:hypothetical protein
MDTDPLGFIPLRLPMFLIIKRLYLEEKVWDIGEQILLQFGVRKMGLRCAMGQVLVFRKRKVSKQSDHQSEGPPVKTITVYHIDYVKQKKIPIGTVMERREKNRPGNLAGLLRIAREKYSSTPQEAFQTAVDASVLLER